MSFTKQFGFGALMLIVASGYGSAATPAAVSGVVRDAQGVAQMGAIVQVISAGSIDVASALTDMHGRFRIAGLLPGSYQVRATSALFMAVTRRNLRLSDGMLATVNLTVSMLSDPVAWLPAERRKPDEPGDDWTWTLRSAANRPILRMLGDGEIIPADVPEARRSSLHARVSVADGGEAFAAGGPHTTLALDRANSDGSDAVVRADTGSATSSTYVAAGYQRTSDFAGSYRMIVSYASDPQISGGGMQVLRMASAKKMQLGDAVDVEAGGTVYAIHTDGPSQAGATSLRTQPFVRVTVHPGEVWAVRYTLATSPGMQSFDGVNSIQADLPVAAMTKGRLETEAGQHQQLSVSRKLGSGALEAAIYHDAVSRSSIAGVNAATPADLPGAPGEVLVDTQTGAFRFLGAGYTATGASLAWSVPVTSSLSATFGCEHGAALAMRAGELSEHAETADSFTASVKGRVLRTGTKVRASYRWQPQHLLTAVDTYETPSRQGYLGFYVRQSVSWGSRLPQGIEATVDVTNLLAEGYQPFLSADGRTLFLAESPRTIQGGLSFTF
jgi:hypothetical protein